MFWKQKRPKQPDPGTPLTGTRQERIMQLLRMAGWYEGRQVDISEIESYYDKQGIHMTVGAKAFFQTYYGLMESWKIGIKCVDPPLELPNPDEIRIDEIEFALFPRPDSEGDSPRYWIYENDDSLALTEECLHVQWAANGPVTMVGHIGYYYPARVWLDEEGVIYATHEYKEAAGETAVWCFHELAELIDWELHMHTLECAYIKS